MVTMRDSRKGECLWQEWLGEGLDLVDQDSLVFSTDAHVDVEHDVVRRALASALQREGVVSSLGHGYGAVDGALVMQGYAGHVDGSRELYVCDASGETRHGDLVDSVLEMTWVEVQ